MIADRVSGFQRLYDLPERVLPRAVLDAPPLPQHEAIRELIVRAVRARGALTEYAIAEHWRGSRYEPWPNAQVRAMAQRPRLAESQKISQFAEEITA